MINWKTSLGGLIAAAGMALMQSTDPIMHFVGMLLNGIGILFLGGTAKDSNVTGGTKSNTTGETVVSKS